MPAQHIAGPYSLAGTGPIVIDGKEERPGSLMRDNDGSLILMAPDNPEESASDRKRIATVGLTIEVKRSERWSVTPEEDPVQMATALVLMAAPDLLEAADGVMCMLAPDHHLTVALRNAIAKARP